MYESATCQNDLDPIPTFRDGEIVSYPQNAHADVWIPLSSQLGTLHNMYALSSYTAVKQIALDGLPAEVPQPCEVSGRLAAATGFRLAHATGMTDTPTFLRRLTQRVFSSATFLRAAHELQFTPQPDWVHEFYGHIVNLHDPRMAELYEHFGNVAMSIRTHPSMTQLAQLYWYSIETGVIREQTSSHAIGAALLSSVMELRGLSRYVKMPFDPSRMATTPYRSDVPQEIVFEARSFDEFLDALHDYLQFMTDAQ